MKRKASGIGHLASGKAPVLAACGLVAVAALAGCRGDTSDAPPRRFFPDMDYQPKYKAQAESRFFRDFDVPEGEAEAGVAYGRTAREPVPGTVPFGRHTAIAVIDAVSGGRPASVDMPADRSWFAELDPRIFEGREQDGSYVERIPIPVDDELMLLGKKQWDVYCTVCHGATAVGGDQAGMVGLRWQYAIPNLHGDAYQPGAGGEQSLDGYLYNIIRNGLKNAPGAGGLEYRMPAYGNRIDTEEAWATVAYLRALQLARRARPDLLDESTRQRLEEQRVQAPPADQPTLARDADTGTDR